MTLLPIGRHNINLSPAELLHLSRVTLGRVSARDGRVEFERGFGALLGVPHVFALESSRVTLAVLLKALVARKGASGRQGDEATGGKGTKGKG